MPVPNSFRRGSLYPLSYGGVGAIVAGVGTLGKARMPGSGLACLAFEPILVQAQA